MDQCCSAEGVNILSQNSAFIEIMEQVVETLKWLYYFGIGGYW